MQIPNYTNLAIPLMLQIPPQLLLLETLTTDISHQNLHDHSLVLFNMILAKERIKIYNILTLIHVLTS